MYLRRCYRARDGKRHAYWALVQSVRTAWGPRQQVVVYLGDMDEQGRLAMHLAAEPPNDATQGELFPEPPPGRFVQVDVDHIRVLDCRSFGGAWLGLQILRKLGLVDLLKKLMPPGREQVPWPMMALVLVLCRLCNPSSELHIAEHSFQAGAISDLLGIPAQKVNDDRLYRALDALLPHKHALEKHLKQCLGELFDLSYDLLLYDVTSTYFEGECAANPLAQRGYSRDGRPDCKQVCIAMVVTRCGYPLGYEIFPGNRADVTTLQEIVATMEARYGKADRIWATDRGMISEGNIDFLKQDDRRYLVGTPKGMLKRYEQQLRDGPWEQVRQGLEVQRCPGPDGTETFILCRSEDRRRKEAAMHEKFEKRIETGVEQIAQSCRKQRRDPIVIAKRIGKLLGQNTRAAGLFDIEVTTGPEGSAQVTWRKREDWRDWSRLSEGCYLLRTNVNDWSGAELWQAYMQLADAMEGAFRIQKSDLDLRPIWHQKPHRVEGHILVCFLAYVLWRTLAGMCRQAGLGDEPRKVLHELSRLQVVDLALPTRSGTELRRRYVQRPDEHQAILLQRLGLHLPRRLEMIEM